MREGKRCERLPYALYGRVNRLLCLMNVRKSNGRGVVAGEEKRQHLVRDHLGGEDLVLMEQGSGGEFEATSGQQEEALHSEEARES